MIGARTQHRRRTATAATLLACVCAVPLAALPGDDEAEAQSARRLNVVVVMTDDQDERSLRVMNATRRLLARRGVTFTNAFATFPLCCPSRATFLTGRYAHNHGVVENKGPNGGFDAFRDRRALPVAMRRAGYRTAYLGKYLNGYGHAGRRGVVPRGWSRWFGLIGSNMFNYSISQNGRVRRYGTKPRDYLTDVLAREASQTIRGLSRGRRPFFLTFAPLAAHVETSQRGETPNPRPAPRHRDDLRGARLHKPPSFDEADVSDKPDFVRERPRLTRRDEHELRRENRDRLASLLSVDDAIQRIVGTLRSTGELGRTVVIFTSDNGWLLGQHRLGGKRKLYEDSVGVPLIMRGPGVPAGARRGQIAGNIDLAPTILDVANARALQPLDGISLMPLARSAGAAAGRDILLENGRGAAVRTRRYMYAEHQGGDRELYDLRRDPHQLRSRHDDPGLAGVRSSLATRLDQLRNCAGAGCR